MSLTNEQYDALMRLYNQKQQRNHQTLLARTEKLYSAIPELSDIDSQVSAASVSSLAAILEGSDPAIAKAMAHEKLKGLKAKRAELMTAAGFPQDYLQPVYDCPDCQDTGFIAGKHCHCFKQAAINIVYKQSNLSSLLKQESFDDFDLSYYSEDYFEGDNPESARVTAQKAFDQANNFVQNFSHSGGNLLLLGQTGCGKTFLSNCIAKALLDKGVSVVYFTAFELFDVFEKQTFKKDIDVSDLHDYIFDCDLLIIDDLGTEFTNTFTNSRLFQCLNERLLRNKSTIISTNLSLSNMRDRYTERITSRVFSQYGIIHLIGEDIRIKKVINK